MANGEPIDDGGWWDTGLGHGQEKKRKDQGKSGNK
jgi:hypothetical protein